MPGDETQQKPVGPFEDFDECTDALADEPGVDDEEALCGWMEQNPDIAQEYDPAEDIEAFIQSLDNAQNVLTDLEVSYVSGVGDPAIDSQWLYAKDAEESGADWGVSAPLLIHKSQPVPSADGNGAAALSPKDEEGEPEQKAWAPVLIPNETDKQGDVIPPKEIESAAHRFLENHRNIDTDHDLLEGKGVPIESWTLKEEQSFTLPDGSESRSYPAGTWMMGVKFTDESWKRVLEGELTGFSIYGEAAEHDVDDIMGEDADDIERTAAAAVPGVEMAKSSDSEESMSEDNDDEPTDDEQTDSASKEDIEEVAEMVADVMTDVSIDEAMDALSELKGDGEDDDDDDDDDDENGMDMSESKDTDESGEEPSLSDIHDAVKDTNETVKSLDSRVDDLEKEVFSEGEEDEADSGEGADEVPDPSEVKETAEETASETAEDTVKSMLGLGADEELPEDEEERAEVIRKHVHETSDEQDMGVGAPDDWNEDEADSVVQ